MKSLILAGIVAASICSQSATAAAKTKSANNDVENNKKIARVWFEEVFVKENLKPLDDIVAKDATMTMSPSYPSKVSGTNKLTGLDQIKQHVAGFTAVAETKGEIFDIVGEGNTVILYRNCTITTPQGTSTDVPWVTIFHFKDGKIADIKHVHDTLFEKNQLDKAAAK
jgi:ketosteroid isomerase-like protein